MESWEVSTDTFKFGVFYSGKIKNPLAESVMQYLKKDVSNIKGYYIDLGRHLSEFKRCKYYEEFGYDNFEECIQENLGLDKGTVSRSINVWRRFLDENNKHILKKNMMNIVIANW